MLMIWLTMMMMRMMIHDNADKHADDDQGDVHDDDEHY